MKQLAHFPSFTVASLAVIFALATAPNVHAQTVEWVRQLVTSSDAELRDTSADGLGNFYVSGTTLGNLSGTNAGGYDAFVSKYDSAGTIQWTRQFGTSSLDTIYDTSPDGLGNVFLFGHTGGNLAGPNAGGVDTFIRKYDEGGNLQWTRQFGTSEQNLSLESSADGQGNLFTLSYNHSNLLGKPTGNVVSKYDSAGVLQWTGQFGTFTYTTGDYPTDISPDGLGNVYIAGETNGSLGGSNAGEFDAFVLKYDSSGTLQWTRQLGSSSRDGSKGVSADSLGNVYIAGGSNGNLGGPNAEGYDAFVSKYDSDGTLQWTRGTSDSYGADVSVDGLGNVYLLGSTSGSLDGTNAGGVDAFVSKYNAAGTLQWTKQFGTSENDYPGESSFDGLGNLYITGYFQGNLGNKVWVAKLSDSAVPEPGTLLLTALALVPFSMRRRVQSQALQRAVKCRLASLAIVLAALWTAAPASAEQLYKLTASDAAAGHFFGSSVALDGTTALVGARFHGAAYVFDVATGEQLHKFEPGASSSVVQSVALNGDRALISKGGVAYLFNTSTGQQLRELAAPPTSDFFGPSVALDANLALVGSLDDNERGAAYLFNASTGEQLRRLTASDGAAHDIFGARVALSGNTALISAFRDDDAHGSAYLFNVTTGQQLFKLTAPDAPSTFLFGDSVALSGNIAIVGASRSVQGLEASGSAYVFDVSTGQLLRTLSPLDAKGGDSFGSSVALSGNMAIIGASSELGKDAGAAYLFDVTTGQQLLKITASDGSAEDEFGTAVALSGNLALIGVQVDDDGGSQSGSAYLFDVTVPEPGTPLLAALALVSFSLRRRVRACCHRPES
jgi:outer membrane protein assembly factor BamB